MLCEYFWEPDGSAKTEVITVDGEEHVVQKRDQHSLGADISVASYLVRILHVQYKFTQTMKFPMDNKIPWQ